VHDERQAQDGERGGARRDRGLRPAARALGRGLAGGVALGVAYRGWMRVVSTEPSFSWAGTLGILGVVTVVVLLVAVAATVLQRSRSRTLRGSVRALSGLSFVLLAAGPGMITVPVWVPAGLALGHPRWPRAVRWPLLGLGALGVVLLAVVSRDAFAELGLVRSGFGLVLYVGLMGVIARLFAVPTGSRIAAPASGTTIAPTPPPARKDPDDDPLDPPLPPGRAGRRPRRGTPVLR
jgi:hypothetical protein